MKAAVVQEVSVKAAAKAEPEKESSDMLEAKRKADLYDKMMAE